MPENIRARVISILQTGSLIFATGGLAAGTLIDTTDKELTFKKGWHVYMMLKNTIPTPLNCFSVKRNSSHRYPLIEGDAAMNCTGHLH